MAITTYENLVAAWGNKQDFLLSKASVSTQGAGGMSSLWKATGYPAAGATPTATAATCVASLAGGFAPTYTCATGLTPYVAAFTATESLACWATFYDRIMHNGGLVGNSTALTAITGFNVSGITDRMIAADYSNLEWYYEIYADIGTTGTTVTFVYDSPTSSVQTAAVAIGGASPLNQDSRAFRIYPNDGHPIVGIKSVRLTATTGTAGSWGITCVRRIFSSAIVPINAGVNMDFAQLGLPKLASAGSCIFPVIITSSTSTGQLDGYFTIITG